MASWHWWEGSRSLESDVCGNQTPLYCHSAAPPWQQGCCDVSAPESDESAKFMPSQQKLSLTVHMCSGQDETTTTYLWNGSVQEIVKDGHVCSGRTNGCLLPREALDHRINCPGPHQANKRTQLRERAVVGIWDDLQVRGIVRTGI